MWGYWEDVKSDYEEKVNDPWDWVTHFENAIARYAGAKHAIACDSNTNAIRLLIHYFKDVISDGGVTRDYNWNIPKNTYVSVPNQLILSGCKFKFIDKKWDDMYRIGSSPIIDAAVCLREGMFNDNFSYDEDCMVLSFHHRKIIQIGKGGMILTNDDTLNEWLRPMIYDGRKKYVKYDTDEFECVGWHMYMTPEDAKKGLELFHGKNITASNESKGSSKTYKDLSKSKIFSKFRVTNDSRIFNHNGDIMLNKIKISNKNGVEYTIQDHIFMRDIDLPFVERDWKIALSNLDLSAAGEEINYILFENIECNDLYFYQNSKAFNYVRKYFQNKGLNHKFIVYGNNLSKVKYNFNYVSMPFFLGDSITQLKPIKKRTFDKKFLFLNSTPKIHRIVSYCKFSDLGLLDNMYYTFNPNNDEDYPFTYDIKKYPNTGKLENSGQLHISDMHQIPPHYYKSFCNIVTESNFVTKDFPMFITEKLDKSITAMQPFLMISTAGFLKELHKLGFKTFSDFWDESYDDIKNDFARLNAVVDIVKDLSKKSNKELEDMYVEMLPILKHNVKTVVNNYMLEHKSVILSEMDTSLYGMYRRMLKKSEGILSKSLI